MPGLTTWEPVSKDGSSHWWGWYCQCCCWWTSWSPLHPEKSYTLCWAKLALTWWFSTWWVYDSLTIWAKGEEFTICTKVSGSTCPRTLFNYENGPVRHCRTSCLDVFRVIPGSVTAAPWCSLCCNLLCLRLATQGSRHPPPHTHTHVLVSDSDCLVWKRKGWSSDLRVLWWMGAVFIFEAHTHSFAASMEWGVC